MSLAEQTGEREERQVLVRGRKMMMKPRLVLVRLPPPSPNLSSAAQEIVGICGCNRWLGRKGKERPANGIPVLGHNMV